LAKVNIQNAGFSVVVILHFYQNKGEIRFPLLPGQKLQPGVIEYNPFWYAQDKPQLEEESIWGKISRRYLKQVLELPSTFYPSSPASEQSE